MKSAAVLLTAITFGGLAIAETTVGRVVVRQQWPWSTDVLIEYTLAGGSDRVDIDIQAWNGTTPLDAAKIKAGLSGDIVGVSGTEGVHRVKFDPIAAFGTAYEAMSAFKVELTASPTAIVDPDEVLYKIVDLTTGAIEDVKRSDFYNNRAKYGTFETDYTVFGSEFSTTLQNVLVWTGVTNDVKYATTHLVLRKIPAGTFTMGADSSEAAYSAKEQKHQVTLNHNFWLGVFPVTQRQNELLGAPANNYFTNALYAATRPADNIRYKEDLRGQTVKDNIDALTGDVVFSRLRTLTGNVASFDLPTEAQWEYACRAMDTGSLYGGLSLSEANLKKIARTKWSGGRAQGRDVDDTKGTAPVGRYVPNPWGLYDMIGQVWELCRDTLAAQPTGTSESQTDPIAQTANGTSTLVPRRGASWDNTNALVEGNYRANFRSTASYMNANPNGGQTALQSGYRISFTEQ